MATAPHTVASLASRVNALEETLKRWKWAAGFSGAVLLGLLGIERFYELPKVVEETLDAKIKEVAGAQALARLKGLNDEFEQLSSAQKVASSRLAGDLKGTFVSLDSPYVIVSSFVSGGPWNLDVNKAIGAEGQPVDISGNGVQTWKLVPPKK